MPTVGQLAFGVAVTVFLTLAVVWLYRNARPADPPTSAATEPEMIQPGETGAQHGSGLSSALVRLVLALFIAVAALIGVSLLNDGTLPGLLDRIPLISSDCVVGLTGAAVSIEVNGPGASGQCDHYANEVTNGGSWYRYSGGTTPGGAVICQVHLYGRVYTVRDAGVLIEYGNEVCQNLIQLANGSLPSQ